MHIETTPYLCLCFLNSWITVAVILAPVQPSGWPRAIAPPLGLTFSAGIPKCLMQYKAWLANASLISNMSISANVSPALLTASGIAKAGPTPIIAGSTPTAAKERKVANIGRFNFKATDLLAKRVAAAPSDVCEEFPAVEHPPSGLNAGFNFLKFSIVVGLGPSSVSTVTVVSFPCASFTVVVTGTI